MIHPPDPLDLVKQWRDEATDLRHHAELAGTEQRYRMFNARAADYADFAQQLETHMRGATP